jgi:hypothetical protein
MTSQRTDTRDVASRRVGYRAVLSVRAVGGRITRPDLRDAFWEAVEGGALELWLDLTAARAIDGSDVRAIEDLATAAHALNRRLLVICPRAVIGCALARAAVDVYPTRAAAQRAP